MTTEPRTRTPTTCTRRLAQPEALVRVIEPQRKRDRRVREPNISLREDIPGGYRNLTPRIPGRRAPDAGYGGGLTSVRSTPSTSRSTGRSCAGRTASSL